MTLAWIDNASVQFPLNIYATKGLTLPSDRGSVRRTVCVSLGFRESGFQTVVARASRPCVARFARAGRPIFGFRVLS